MIINHIFFLWRHACYNGLIANYEPQQQKALVRDKYTLVYLLACQRLCQS